MRILIQTVALCVAARSALRAQDAAQRPDTLLGRVTSAATNTAISGAQVFVTRGPDRLVQQDTTDADGRWRLIFTPGTGDYLVFISSPGAASFRKRVTRTGNEQRFVVDAVLGGGAVAQLAAVRVQAQAPRPNRADRTGPQPTTGSNERIAEGVFGAISPTAAGNPLAAAATIPGLNVGPGGVSALGTGGDQSLITLNGLASGATVPRQARTRTRASLSNYDPAVGGFSGALVSQELEPGREDTQRDASFTLDAPAFRAGDPLARAYGLRPATFQASLGQTGQIVDNRLYYSTAAQLSRRSATQASLLSSSSQVLALNGLDPSDVAQVQQGLSASGVPLNGRLGNTVVDQLSLIAQLDRTPAGAHAIRLTGLVDAQRSDGLGFTPVALPGVDNRERSLNTTVQFGSVAFFGKPRPYQNDFRTSLSLRTDTRSAGSPLPAGAVRVPDLVADPLDPAAQVPTLSFAGFNGSTGTQRTVTFEIADDLSWLRGGRRHLFKLHGWTRIDGLNDATVTNERGTFGFNALSDLTNNRPAVFTRTLAQPSRDGIAWNGATAFAHRWAPSRVFQLLWGARLETNRFLGTPARNTALESALGLRTDRTPDAIGISPRIGATWYIVKEAAGGVVMRSTDLSSQSTLPVGMIRMGAGEFRGLYRPGALAEADGATGMPDALRRLTCIGATAPVPQWSQYASGSLPTSCATGAPTLADAAPPVAVLGPDYRPPRNYRASLGWTSRFAKIDYRIDATYALNRDQASFVDRNLRAAPVTSLASEGGRAMFVAPSDIDAGSGGVSPVSARFSRSFGSVVERLSDLQGRAANLTLSLTPDLSAWGSGDGYLNVNYTYASARSQARGFEGGTAGDPRAIEWARSPFDIRHQVLAQFAKSLPGGIGVSVFLGLESGVPFTPSVGGDVNGDGRANDRAFVSATSTPALAALIENAPSAVAKCLSAQRGRISTRNSCSGPWNQTMQLRIEIPGRIMRLPPRARLAVQFANPLGALDRAFNGADDLRGWGTRAAPDPVLLVPRGFDAATNAFRYDVNPRFGDTRPSRISRPLEPYGVTLDMRLDLSANGEVQELRRQLKPGRNGDSRPRLSTDSLLARYQRSMPSLFVGLQALSDTLLLTPSQIDSIAMNEARYRATLDTIYRPLATYLAALGETYNGDEALKKVQLADSLAWEVTYASGATAKATLSPLQVTIVPQFIRRLLDESPESLRRDHARYEFTVTPQGSNFSMNRR